ncbi:Hypothetical predicted protein [Pelobates cultripes]|uniref:Uncharacterized protein n=1 Tax=Pelobates cultripes TaxID=61616 RepID=A0AAD1RFL1_PELCU|nr:Hypothetical predicted protein [Pelobates cultripes]
MAPTSPTGSDNPSLERIEDELQNLAASVVRKANMQTLTATIQDTLKAEMAGIRSEVAAQAGRIHTVEEATAALTTRLASADTAVARQVPNWFWGHRICHQDHREGLDTEKKDPHQFKLPDDAEIRPHQKNEYLHLPATSTNTLTDRELRPTLKAHRTEQSH